MKFNACLFRQLSLFALTCSFTIAAAGADPLSPKGTYLKYRTALAAANKIEDLSSFLCKQVNEEIKQTPAEMKPMMFSLMKETSPQQVKVLSEDISGDSAKIALASEAAEASKTPNVSEDTSGTVTFLKEEGEWKIQKESWNSKVVVK